MMLRHRHLDRVAEHGTRIGRRFARNGTDLIPERLPRDGVEPRRSELQIRELHQRLEILR
jgi:hypothetical protein